MDGASRLSVTEHAHVTKMAQNLGQRLREAQAADSNGRETLRRQVLSLTVAENYEGAVAILKAYVDGRVDFIDFQVRVQRYVDHCSELIMAVKTKRNFPGFSQLALSKQQEIHEKVLEHFEELKVGLKQIEKVERDERVTDVRSTVLVLQALCITVFAICAIWFFRDLQRGLFSNFVNVTMSLIDDITIAILKKLGL